MLHRGHWIAKHSVAQWPAASGICTTTTHKFKRRTFFKWWGETGPEAIIAITYPLKVHMISLLAQQPYTQRMGGGGGGS